MKLRSLLLLVIVLFTTQLAADPLTELSKKLQNLQKNLQTLSKSLQSLNQDKDELNKQKQEQLAREAKLENFLRELKERKRLEEEKRKQEEKETKDGTTQLNTEIDNECPICFTEWSDAGPTMITNCCNKKICTECINEHNQTRAKLKIEQEKTPGGNPNKYNPTCPVCGSENPIYSNP